MKSFDLMVTGRTLLVVAVRIVAAGVLITDGLPVPLPLENKAGVADLTDVIDLVRGLNDIPDFGPIFASAIKAVRAIIAAVFELTTVGFATIVLLTCPLSSRTIFPESRIEDITDERLDRLVPMLNGSKRNLPPSKTTEEALELLLPTSIGFASVVLTCWKATPTFRALFMS